MIFPVYVYSLFRGITSVSAGSSIGCEGALCEHFHFSEYSLFFTARAGPIVMLKRCPQPLGDMLSIYELCIPADGFDHIGKLSCRWEFS